MYRTRHSQSDMRWLKCELKVTSVSSCFGQLDWTRTYRPNYIQVFKGYVDKEFAPLA